MSRSRIIGLHITKCSGTSLISSIRSRLQEDQYYFCSSYFANTLASRPTFVEITRKERLWICFGHYVNELYLPIIGANAYLFTGLRNPIRRAVSHFGQENWIRFQAGRPLVSAEDYLNSKPGTICVELRRAFPTVARLGPNEEWKQALLILSLFNYVYMTEKFVDHVGAILNLLEIPDAGIVSDNVTERRQYPDDVRDYLRSESEKLQERAKDYYHNDIIFFEVLCRICDNKEGLNWMNPSVELKGTEYFADRSELVASLPGAVECIAKIASLELRYMVNEFKSLGKLELLREHFSLRIDNARKGLELIDDVQHRAAR